jgi:hypothetical protein
MKTEANLETKEIVTKRFLEVIKGLKLEKQQNP